MNSTAKKVSELEKAMMELVYQSRLTEIKIAQLSEESRLTEAQLKESSRELKAALKKMSDELAETDRKFRAKMEENDRKFRAKMEENDRKMKAKMEETDMKFKAELAETDRKTRDELSSLSKEMKEFKDEMRASKKEMDKKWGDLARKMGTLVEDIFIPSFDLAIEKYFGIVPEDVMPRRRIRKGDRETEVDILALADGKAFVVEVKASPDRREYIHDFIEKLAELPGFLPEIKNYKVIPIYAALDMQKNTVSFLTKNNIYAMIVRGDLLEIVNFGEVAG
jgi:exonuclease VII large subunit